MSPKNGPEDGASRAPAPRTPPPRTAAPRTPPPHPLLGAILASAPGSVFLLGLDGRYLFLSRGLSGASMEEAAGKTLEQVLAPELAAELRALMARVGRSGKPRTVEVSAPDAFGRPRRYLVSLAPYVAGGRMDGYVGVGMLANSEEGAPADPGAAELASRLTPKQRDVLVFVAEGLSSREIGRRLGVSERTVETHREQLMDRLDIRGVAALSRFALAAGLL